MKKILLGMALVAYSFGAFASDDLSNMQGMGKSTHEADPIYVDLSNWDTLVFINENDDDIKASFRPESCDDSGSTGNMSFNSGLYTIPEYSAGNIDAFLYPSDGQVYSCVTLNDNDNNDDIVFDGSIRYDAGSTNSETFYIVTMDDNYEGSLCYAHDVDGIDGNDDKYVYPSYEGTTLTIHISDSLPNELSICD